MLSVEWSQGCYGRTDGQSRYYIPIANFVSRGDNNFEKKVSSLALDILKVRSIRLLAKFLDQQRYIKALTFLPSVEYIVRPYIRYDNILRR